MYLLSWGCYEDGDLKCLKVPGMVLLKSLPLCHFLPELLEALYLLEKTPDAASTE